MEGNEDFILTIDPSLPTGVNVGTPDEATMTIVDDDRKKFCIDNTVLLVYVIAWVAAVRIWN